MVHVITTDVYEIKDMLILASDVYFSQFYWNKIKTEGDESP